MRPACAPAAWTRSWRLAAMPRCRERQSPVRPLMRPRPRLKRASALSCRLTRPRQRLKSFRARGAHRVCVGPLDSAFLCTVRIGHGLLFLLPCKPCCGLNTDVV